MADQSDLGENQSGRARLCAVLGTSDIRNIGALWQLPATVSLRGTRLDP